MKDQERNNESPRNLPIENHFQHKWRAFITRGGWRIWLLGENEGGYNSTRRTEKQNRKKNPFPNEESRKKKPVSLARPIINQFKIKYGAFDIKAGERKRLFRENEGVADSTKKKQKKSFQMKKQERKNEPPLYLSMGNPFKTRVKRIWPSIRPKNMTGWWEWRSLLQRKKRNRKK